MLKILQAGLEQNVNRELPGVQDGFIFFNLFFFSRRLYFIQDGFRKGRGTRDQIADIHWIMEKAREF